ncbi:MAG: mechanosensitive ion channel domain-containing protein [Lyngbya sp.]|nr:mechanosensitive ion channel domain-containing protein [Lyngbya sp.]
MIQPSVLQILAGNFSLNFAFLTDPLLKIGNKSVSILAVLNLTISLIIAILLSRLFKQLLKQQLLTKLKIDASNREVLSTILGYGFGVLACILVLQANGIDIASLAILAGGLGIGIGFGLQDITKNFVSGLTILLERKIKVGDFIELDGMSGYVKEISIRSTLIETFDQFDVVVPNSQLVENRLVNMSLDSFRGRIKIPVGVAYGSDPVIVTEILLDCAYSEPNVLHDPSPKVKFIGFGDNSLDFELWVYVNQIDTRISVKSSILYIIEHQFRQHDISIPFPQRDLWVRTPETFPLSSQPEPQKRKLSISSQSPSETPPKPIFLKDILKNVCYFKYCNDFHLRQLIEFGYRKQFEASEVVFREGETGEGFYIILSGSVEAYLEKVDRQIDVLKTHNFFGEFSLMLGIPQPASIRCLEETTLFIIHKNNFKTFIKDKPDLVKILAEELAKRQEIIANCQIKLKQMGLIEESEHHQNPVVWIRQRIQKLFNPR